MATFRKKPVVIEAVQVDELLLAARNDWQRLPTWIREAYDGKTPACGILFAADSVQVLTLEGAMVGNRGDWIVCGVKGELYPIKPDIFAETYELVTSDPTDRAAGEG